MLRVTRASFQAMTEDVRAVNVRAMRPATEAEPYVVRVVSKAAIAAVLLFKFRVGHISWRREAHLGCLICVHKRRICMFDMQFLHSEISPHLTEI